MNLTFLSCEGEKFNLRRFQKKDVPNKVQWLNDPEINKFLHYDLPLCEERTEKWFDKVIFDHKRIDFTIEKGLETRKAVGLIGLINLDFFHRKGEFYILIGEKELWGTDIAFQGSKTFLNFVFKKFDLNKIYLFTEKENKRGQGFFEKLGFCKEGLLRDDIYYMGRFADRYIYSLKKEEFLNG